jgi:hypothetical protein
MWANKYTAVCVWKVRETERGYLRKLQSGELRFFCDVLSFFHCDFLLESLVYNVFFFFFFWGGGWTSKINLFEPATLADKGTSLAQYVTSQKTSTFLTCSPHAVLFG